MDSKKQQQTQQGAPESDKTTSAHKVKPSSRKEPQKPTCVSISATQQAKQQPAQERVRPEGMNRRQWKNFKHMRRVLALWPELFDLDNPKPLRVGVLDDLMQDISARNLTIGAGVLKAALASYTRRIRYQKALAAGGARYDLNGQPCGEITPEQQQEAADALKKAKGEQSDQRDFDPLTLNALHRKTNI
ncbi:proQ/FINO family protein [Salmonella enterica]|nr:proQ/FINO family protein [Salmonella enterica]EEF4030108.1 proQ/FINO family protein [Salmonella enterica]EEJ5983289.1 proQ/FINO family protein [Salmonella enterica]EEL9687092.1 proQ/FINO family protein [Salmonella enterica]EEU3909717.1 proQ/FINO family protein [Salmonella enterica]